MGPCINEQQLKTVMGYVESGKNEGAKLLAGGNRLDSGAYAKDGFMSRRCLEIVLRTCAWRRRKFLAQSCR